jgi:threonylcarbamoyladenosine tRNA methylthiotransferase MtaB
MRVHVSSLGCKLNQSEMESLAMQLVQRGHQIVASPAEADLCVLNTCAVTSVAEQKTRQALRRLHRENPNARLVATGCYAELSPAEFQEMAGGPGLPGVVLVAGNRAKAHLADLLAGTTAPTDRVCPADRVRPASTPATAGAPSEGRTPVPNAQLPIARTRALVKIQDGCDNACTYCIIHVARGPQRSRPADQVLAEVQARLAAGHKEIVLTGVHIGAYGRDRGTGSGGAPGAAHSPSTDLWALVRRILAETEVPRLRLSSIEPWDLPPEALDLWSNARLCPHLHLPLQSGADAVLRRMGRRYTTAKFTALVDAARAAIPDLAVTTDVIAGFPGETAAEHAESLAFVAAMGFARVHVFPYSLRPGTPAAQMPGQVAPPVKAERASALRAAATASAAAFCQRFVGRTVSVLWESSRPGRDGAVWNGLTGNYLRVHTLARENLANSLTPTRLVALTRAGLQGRIETG